MVKLNNLQPSATPTSFNQTNTQFTEQPSQTQANQSTSLISLPPALMQVIPWIPFALEAMTGQKIPQIGGTMGEIQASLQQIQLSQQQLLTNQQQLFTKLTSLETNASQQLTSLNQQLTNTNNSFRLLATETKKSLEFNPRPELPASEENY